MARSRLQTCSALAFVRRQESGRRPNLGNCSASLRLSHSLAGIFMFSRAAERHSSWPGRKYAMKRSLSRCPKGSHSPPSSKGILNIEPNALDLHHRCGARLCKTCFCPARSVDLSWHADIPDFGQVGVQACWRIETCQCASLGISRRTEGLGEWPSAPFRQTTTNLIAFFECMSLDFHEEELLHDIWARPPWFSLFGKTRARSL